ncbi:MAG: glycosyltransferase family 4 protein [Rhodospirillales bacterium]|jgi:glycosyltransferase involved in cell wall biosynthesis|nr:glycosyltransferase family 4 protein [Rhodospirillales bacterium]
MKVIVNALSAKTGGIVTYTHNLMRSFAERNVDAVFAISPDFPVEVDVPVMRLAADRMSPVRRVLWEQTVWRRIVARYKPDVLYSSANFGLLFPPVPQILLVREGGLFDPFYLTNVAPALRVRTIFQRMARRKLIIASARSSLIVLTPTNAVKGLLVSHATDLEGRIDKNQYGTISEFSNTSPRSRQWSKDGILQLLYVSAYYPHKQPGLVSEAVADLNEQGIACHLTLTMDLDGISETPGGDKDHFLLTKGIERGQVTMLGQAPYQELPEMYKNHDVFIFPSLSETFGHPLAEAMGLGIPIIASDTPVHREVCKDAALFFSSLSPSDLARRVRNLDENETLRNLLTKNGQKYVSNNFMWESHVDRLLCVFTEITKNP